MKLSCADFTFPLLPHEDVLALVRLTEADTTPSSRIFAKVLVQELVEFMGLARLRARAGGETARTPP